MALNLFNTLTRKKEEFKPWFSNEVNLYTCGPTVYDFAHIGNLRSYIFADTLRRALIHNGYGVRWVMNVTDVDDKIIKHTIEKHGDKAGPEELRSFTDRYYNAFLKNLAEVNIPENTITFIRVSDVIPQIQEFIIRLIDKKYAYEADDGSVYFSIQKYQKDFGDYGELVGKNFLKGKKIGVRVKMDDYDKEDVSDFALWKAHDAQDGQIFWSHPKLGKGRPGWHIECSVINSIGFGEHATDLHTGGVDLIFPHHTNEIAQSQPFYKPFVRHWAHNEHLLVNGKKMAKREKNYYTLEDLKKETPEAGLPLRHLMLQAHYKSQTNFTPDSLQAAKNGLKSLNQGVERLTAQEFLSFSENPTKSTTVSYEQAFQKELNDDLNTPQALARIQAVIDDDTLSRKQKLDFLRKFDQALGIGLSFEYSADPKALKLADQREKARTNKQFMQADELRKQIEALGYIIEDTPQGPLVIHK